MNYSKMKNINYLDFQKLCQKKKKEKERIRKKK
jgi:hypothetical protein